MQAMESHIESTAPSRFHDLRSSLHSCIRWTSVRGANAVLEGLWIALPVASHNECSRLGQKMSKAFQDTDSQPGQPLFSLSQHFLFPGTRVRGSGLTDVRNTAATRMFDAPQLSHRMNEGIRSKRHEPQPQKDAKSGTYHNSSEVRCAWEKQLYTIRNQFTNDVRT